MCRYGRVFKLNRTEIRCHATTNASAGQKGELKKMLQLLQKRQEKSCNTCMFKFFFFYILLYIPHGWIKTHETRNSYCVLKCTILICDICGRRKENICGRPLLLTPPPSSHIPASWFVHRHQTRGLPGVKRHKLRIGIFTVDSSWRHTAAAHLLWLRLGCGVSQQGSHVLTRLCGSFINI